MKAAWFSLLCIVRSSSLGLLLFTINEHICETRKDLRV
jgi:hypothetical protein